MGIAIGLAWHSGHIFTPIRQVNATFKKAPKAEAVQGEEQRLGL